MADSLLKEVDAALRADRAGALWARHRSTVIAVIVALLVGTAASSAWHSYREAKGGEMLLKLTDAQKQLEGGKPAEAAQAFGDIAAGASGEFKDLALVWQSRALVNAGNTADAVAPLKEAVADGHNLWADIACLRLAGLDAAAAEPCLSAQAESPLAATRAEWAAAALWEKGDVAAAKAAMAKLLADPATSPDTRTKLMQWSAIMTETKH